MREEESKEDIKRERARNAVRGLSLSYCLCPSPPLIVSLSLTLAMTLLNGLSHTMSPYYSMILSLLFSLLLCLSHTHSASRSLSMPVNKII